LLARKLPFQLGADRLRKKFRQCAGAGQVGME